MGKIRVKTFDESQEDKDKKLKAKREGKKTRVAGMGGGERTIMVGTTEEELEKQVGNEPAAAEGSRGTKKGKKAKFAKKKEKGAKYKGNASLVDKKKAYPLSQAVDILKKFKKGKFDETVELHVNVGEKGVAGQVALPHGTGKKLRIAVADEAIIAKIEKGKIDFDILVAEPSMMQRLAKVAKILGPRGLMPNPKAGTITEKIEETVKKLSAGQVNFKTEAAAPIIHMSVGKVSFEEKQLVENAKIALEAIGAAKISSATLKATMSPGIRINVTSL